MGVAREVLTTAHLDLVPAVMTTPAYWTEGLLKLLARLSMVSAEELDEHKRQYQQADMRSILMDAGFGSDQVKFGYFEAGMNIWATASSNR